jgi:N-acylneuraminate cytidylyltransferase/CMP-N,N'-diacetyllegionaminic acid synthase
MIAIVPARGGSKGLPGKNIRTLFGKPMIAYTIEAALKSKYVQEIIISTDDKKIADIAVANGAICPFMRPPDLAKDDSQAVDTYLYTVEKLNGQCEYDIKEFVVLQPTSPLRIAEDIDKTIDIFYKRNADSAASFTKESHPIVWHKYLDDDGKIVKLFTEDQLLNRQEIKPSYYPNGAVYVFQYDLLKKNRIYYTQRSYAYVMPFERSVDIDTIDDFEYAEFLLRRRHEKQTDL